MTTVNRSNTPIPVGAAEAPQPQERVLSTLNRDGTRRWLRPRPSRGRFVRARHIVAFVLIAIFTVLPYIHLGGRPIMLLDLAARRFTIFGMTFLPTDTLLLALFMVGVFVGIFLLTALLGRVWCGWACPQTVYLEFVYRPIERFFEGTPGRKNQGRFRGSGLAKFLKYTTYLIISLYLAHTFLAYFVGVEQLAQWVRRSPLEHPAGFLVMVSTAALMMFDFCYFREQTCIVACPYGRFQSVMLDRDSMIVTYDAARGEPRGKAKKKQVNHNETAALRLPVLSNGALRVNDASSPGDCVDCGLCVATCPTGIDIRDGLQMECIGCAQCIDACDAVMEKLGRARGLIRYSSQNAVSGGQRRILRPRVLIYALALLIITGMFGLSLARTGVADLTVMRGLGRPFTELNDNQIANHVRVKIINRTDAHKSFNVEAVGIDGLSVQAEENPMRVPAGESKTAAMMIVAPRQAFVRGRLEITVRVSDGAEFSQEVQFQLLGPGNGAAAAPSTTKGVQR